MSDQEFDNKYVSELRSEAASWRTKYRELEAQIAYKDVEVELAKRGVSADPSWVTIQENQSVSEAVNELIAKHPNLNTTTTPDAPEAPETRVIKPRAPAAIQAGPTNSNVPPNPMASRSVDEVKKDPKARSQLRDHYRSLIRRESNQSEEY